MTGLLLSLTCSRYIGKLKSSPSFQFSDALFEILFVKAVLGMSILNHLLFSVWGNHTTINADWSLGEKRAHLVILNVTNHKAVFD